MRLSQRLVAAAVLVTLSGALAGCSSSLGSWDPSDLLDFLDSKKKLPGERKEVFPQGVPGLEQGVPKELYKGQVEQQQLDQQNADAAAAAAPPPQEPEARKSRSRSKKPATASTAPEAAPDPNAAPDEEGAPAAVLPAPKPKKTAHKRTTAPPPDQEAAQPAATAVPAQPARSAQQSAQPFPAPLPGGSFSH
jgi:hypothetical protein